MYTHVDKLNAHTCVEYIQMWHNVHTCGHIPCIHMCRIHTDVTQCTHMWTDTMYTHVDRYNAHTCRIHTDVTQCTHMWTVTMYTHVDRYNAHTCVEYIQMWHNVHTCGHIPCIHMCRIHTDVTQCTHMWTDTMYTHVDRHNAHTCGHIPCIHMCRIHTDVTQCTHMWTDTMHTRVNVTQ